MFSNWTSQKTGCLVTVRWEIYVNINILLVADGFLKGHSSEKSLGPKGQKSPNIRPNWFIKQIQSPNLQHFMQTLFFHHGMISSGKY